MSVESMPGDGGLARAPLAGVTVVELGHSLSAPYAGHILRHLGAEVIKVEEAAAGDYARGWGAVRAADAAVMFHAINCGKSSLTVDLRDPVARDSLRHFIIERADVVIQNMRAGGVERVGLDADRLRAEKPGLIYCNISAFGRTGPLQAAPGYDPLVQAMSGMMSLLGRPGDPALRIPVSVNDMGSGMWSVIGVLAALLDRGRTGQGATIDTSLYETALSWITVQLSDFLNSGVAPERQGSGNANIVPYQAFRCADGELMIAAGNDRLFRGLAEALERPDLADDPRFAGNAARIAHKAELLAQLGPVIGALPVADLQQRLEARGVPSGPILSVPQAATAEQTVAVGILTTTPDDQVQMVGFPLTMDGARLPVPGRAPRLGEHNTLLQERQDEAG